MLGLRSYLKIVVEELNKHDWSWDNKNRYSDFFDRVAPLLTPQTREILNAKLKEFSAKYWGLRTIQCEHIIYAMQHNLIGKKLYFKKVLRNEKEWDEVIKIDVDWMAMELDLRDIKNWCFNTLKRMVIERDIDFSREENLNLSDKNV